MIFRASNASLPSQGFWGRFKTPKGGKEMKLEQQQPQPAMPLARQRLLTLAFGDMETIRVVCAFATALQSPDAASDCPLQLPSTYAVR